MQIFERIISSLIFLIYSILFTVGNVFALFTYLLKISNLFILIKKRAIIIRINTIASGKLAANIGIKIKAELIKLHAFLVLIIFLIVILNYAKYMY